MIRKTISILIGLSVLLVGGYMVFSYNEDNINDSILLKSLAIFAVAKVFLLAMLYFLLPKVCSQSGLATVGQVNLMYKLSLTFWWGHVKSAGWMMVFGYLMTIGAFWWGLTGLVCNGIVIALGLSVTEQLKKLKQLKENEDA